MKAACLLLMLLPLLGSTQPFLLLDRHLERPVEIQEQFDFIDIAGGAVPLYAQDVAPLVHCLDTLSRQVAGGAKLPPMLQTTISEHCSVMLWYESQGNISGSVRVSDGKLATAFSFARNQNRKMAARRLKQLVDYIRNNRLLAGEKSGLN